MSDQSCPTVQLVAVRGKHAGMMIDVGGPRFVIGRAEDCQLRPQSEAIGHRHVEIVLQPGEVLLRDLGSQGGTHVNGKSVAEPVRLRNGDHLGIGPLAFTVLVEEGQTAANTARPPSEYGNPSRPIADEGDGEPVIAGARRGPTHLEGGDR